MEDFLGYLNDWEKTVNEREGFSKDERKRMTKSGDSRWFAYDRYVHNPLGCGSYTIFSVSLWICGNGTILTLPEKGVMSFIRTLQSRSSGIIFWSVKGSGRKV